MGFSSVWIAKVDGSLKIREVMRKKNTLNVSVGVMTILTVIVSFQARRI